MKLMATNKKTVDVIGSIDDYGIEPENNEPLTRVVEDKVWTSPRIIKMVANKVLIGDSYEDCPADPCFLVGENRWGDKVVWPLHPYCIHCSPAATQSNDKDLIATFDDFGAEQKMSRKESRLTSLSPSNYYSFTLIEVDGNVICTKCLKQSDDEQIDDVDSQPYGVQKEVDFERAIFDVTKPMLGIRVDEGLFRLPEHLVSYWVESLDFDNTNLSILRKGNIYSIKGNIFMKRAIYEAGTAQWLLNPDYCDESPTLSGVIVSGNMSVKQDVLKEWRLTAIPLDCPIVAEHEGAYWKITQGDFIKNGNVYESAWIVPLQKCEGPLVGVKDL
jgi:hypothetical protein